MNNLQANLCLLAVTLCWSCEVVIYSVIPDGVNPFATTCVTALNIFAQRRATAAQSTVIYSSEIVFSTIWACCLPAPIVDPVQLTVPIFVGCALVVAGNLVEIAPFGRKEPDATQRGPEEATTEGASAAAGPGQQRDVMSSLLGRLEGRSLALAVATMVACACVQAALIAPAVAVLYPDVNVALFAVAVVGNGAAFPVLFATPFMVLMQEELGFKPCA